jgi:predicted nuclease of predicted toxin-antitoxin system
MSTAEDIEIINKARSEDRVVITLDADFHALLALDKATTPSVIRIRIESLQAKAFTELLLRVISECIEELQQGVAVTVEPRRIRIRRLPLN